MNFGPVLPSVPVGDTVQWLNENILKYSATALDGRFNVDLSPGKSGRTVMRRTGMIKFRCKYHPSAATPTDYSPTPRSLPPTIIPSSTIRIFTCALACLFLMLG
jgi:hypothetical protein